MQPNTPDDLQPENTALMLAGAIRASLSAAGYDLSASAFMPESGEIVFDINLPDDLTCHAIRIECATIRPAP